MQLGGECIGRMHLYGEAIGNVEQFHQWLVLGPDLAEPSLADWRRGGACWPECGEPLTAPDSRHKARRNDVGAHIARLHLSATTARSSAQQRCDRLGNDWDLYGGEAGEVDAATRHKIDRLLIAKSLQLRVIQAEQ